MVPRVNQILFLRYIPTNFSSSAQAHPGNVGSYLACPIFRSIHRKRAFLTAIRREGGTRVPVKIIHPDVVDVP
jgi:hypothetical protein